MEIKKASLQDLDLLIPLFNAYRVFYEQKSDLAAARAFIKERFLKNETLILLAMDNETPVGFTQIYTTFSSVSLQPIFILNDLFVSPEARKKGIGEALLNSTKQYCKQAGYKGIALETAALNPAQKLYERLGWTKDEAYLHYFWPNS